MKAFLDYISEVTNTEPFKITLVDLGVDKLVRIIHNNKHISTLGGMYNFTFKVIFGDIKTPFYGTIFESYLAEWRFL